MTKELIPAEEVVRHIATYAKGKLLWKIETLPEELLQESAEDLEKDQVITDTDKKLRIMFHQELARAAMKGEKMVVSNICKGICHSNSFLVKIDDPKKLAWLMLPYQAEELRVSHQVVQAQDVMDELLSIDIYYRDDNGRKTGLNMKAADLKYKAAKLIYDKKYATKQHKVEEDAKDKPKPSNIEERIKLLETELNKP